MLNCESLWEVLSFFCFLTVMDRCCVTQGLCRDFEPESSRRCQKGQACPVPFSRHWGISLTRLVEMIPPSADCGLDRLCLGVGLSCSLSFFLLLRTSWTFTFLQSSLCWWWVSGGFVPEERGFTLFPRRIWVARMGCINLWKDFCLMFTVWHWEDVWVRLHRDTELIGYMYRYCKEEWTHRVVTAKSQDGMPAG